MHKWAIIVRVYTHSGSDDSAISMSIDSADDTGDEVEQSIDAVVAQLLHAQPWLEAQDQNRPKTRTTTLSTELSQNILRMNSMFLNNNAD